MKIERTPKRKTFQNPVVISFLVEKDTRDFLQKVAEFENVSMGDVLRTAINLFLKEYTKTKEKEKK